MQQGKITRRTFLSALAGLPIVGKYWKPKENPYLPEDYRKRLDVCPFCKKTPRCQMVPVRPTLPCGGNISWGGDSFIIECRINENFFERVQPKNYGGTFTITRAEINEINSDVVGYMKKKKILG